MKIYTDEQYRHEYATIVTDERKTARVQAWAIEQIQQIYREKNGGKEPPAVRRILPGLVIFEEGTMWYQLWVKHPHDVVARIQQYGSTLRRIGALPDVTPDHVPIKNADGTIEIRILYGGAKTLQSVKNYLQFWGFVIERERENEYAET